MNLLSIKKTFAFSYALGRYNQRKKSKVRTIDLAVLYVLYMDGYACKRVDIVSRLKVLRRTVTYTLLNNRLEYLTRLNLVSFKTDHWRAKKYSITLEGKCFLHTIEDMTRAVRLDKLKDFKL